MHRTQVYLEDGQYSMLRTQARRQGKTLAAVIREILDAHLGTGGSARRPRDPMEDVIGLGKGDGSAVAENHAEYLYGRQRGGKR